MDTALLIIIGTILFPIAFAGLWCGVLVLIARVGGWRTLAAVYHHDAPFRGELWHMQSAQLGWTRYSAVLTVGADRGGLYLRPIWPFRIAHPPLFIPWGEVSGAKVTFLFTFIEFRFQRAPGVRVRVTARLGARLAEAAGGIPGLDGS